MREKHRSAASFTPPTGDVPQPRFILRKITISFLQNLKIIIYNSGLKITHHRDTLLLKMVIYKSTILLRSQHRYCHFGINLLKCCVCFFSICKVIYHCRRQIKYSKDKMWYLAKLIRGMSIDQALAQLEFMMKWGREKGVEVWLKKKDCQTKSFPIILFFLPCLAASTSGRGQYLKRIRYHGRGRFGIMEKVYCHYFVKLVEGPPPPPEPPKTAVTHAKEYIQQLRNRTIIHTL
ncbi:hypothetical protein QTO34_016278 [Cnephaeus nilssonii]|uniref:Large ribosomal subunit protein uL22m n=1 Tax=Cnephaeus nilssonii TaxID=3371016 RepID=A0AA40LTL2_CNENI|nr:hypothetical protein QTO34_016278 [Eptesicus nilssonii]